MVTNYCIMFLILVNGEEQIYHSNFRNHIVSSISLQLQALPITSTLHNFTWLKTTLPGLNMTWVHLLSFLPFLFSFPNDVLSRCCVKLFHLIRHLLSIIRHPFHHLQSSHTFSLVSSSIF